jgi:chromosome segregation ATPase
MNSENPNNSPATSLPTSDPVLADALSGIEQGLTQIRRMSREADELRQRLDAQQAALRSREIAVADKITALDADKQQLETERQALRDDRAALDELTTWTEQKHAELATREQALHTRESTIHTRESEVAELESGLNTRRDELRSLAESIEARKSELESREQAFAQREKALAELESALNAQRDTITAQTTELAAQRQNLAAQATRLAEVEKDIAKRETTAKESLAKAEQAEARAKRDQNDLAQLRQNLTSAQQQASQMLKALQEATARAEAAEKVALDLRTELDQSASRDEESQAAAQERDALRKAAETLRDKLRETEEREARLNAAVKALREQGDVLAKERDELKIAVERAHDSAAKASADPAELASLKSTLAKAESERDENSSRLSGTLKELGDARLIIDDLRGQLEQHERDTKELETVLDQLRERLRTEAAKAEAFAEQARTTSQPQPAPQAEPAAGTGNPVRMRRIELARKLARDKAKKIRRVSDALGKRYEQCEQVLALRQDVLAAKRSVEAAHRKQQGEEARSRTASSLFFLACTASVLAVGSWFIAGQVAPETYTAKVVFAADSPDRQLSAGELEEWNSFHTQLVEDPRFHEFASQRLAKQGLAGLGTPTALRERLKESAEITSNKPGEMTIEMKGLGRERVERELQMIAITLQSQAREAKDRRADGANTIISQPAKAGAEPVESVRTVYAGGIFGGGVLIFGVLAGVFWSRLANAKMKFDLSQSVDATADEDRWNKFERKAA